MNIDNATNYAPNQVNNDNNIREDTIEQENVEHNTVDYGDVEDV